MMYGTKSGLIGGILWWTALVALPGERCIAQISSDGTLPQPTQVSSNDHQNFVVTEGSQRGANLFHSFREFSIPSQGSVLFMIPAAARNLIGRVTGNFPSTLEGLWQTSSPVNVFFLNPNGIFFGPQARLNVGGSFLASTAQSLRFADGQVFSAIAQPEPLLTVSVPVGLQFGHQAQPIQVQQSILSAYPGTTLGLVGGELTLNRVQLKAPGGRIELGSVAPNSVIGLIQDGNHYSLNYDSVQQFRDIQVLRGSAIDVTDLASLFGLPEIGSGAIQVVGHNLTITDGSFFGSFTYGQQSGQALRLMAKGTLTLSGVGNTAGSNDPNSITSSAIATTTLNDGKGGDIEIQSQNLMVEGGAAISTRSFLVPSVNPQPTGQSGNLTLEVTGTTTIRGYSTQTGVSNLLVSTETPGNAGQLTLKTGQLNLTGGGRIAAESEGSGNGGNIVISASQGMLVSGQGLDVVVSPSNPSLVTGLVLSPTQVTATTNALGQAGNITIQTPQLQVEQGAEISVSTLGTGNGGNLGINSDRLTVNDQGKLLAISSSQGQAGNLTIQGQEIQLDRQGVLAVSSTGEGDAGNLTLQAENLTLNHQSQIIAETTTGQGGNINLDLQNLLLLRNQSLISATAGVEGGGGNGGNIDIQAQFVVAFPQENSDIIANAYTGTGGNILINALGIYGLEARTTLTPFSDITASSTFGERGTIALNRLDLDPQSGLLKLEDEVIDPRQLVLQTCSPGGSFSEGTFTISGRGGLPPNPTENWEVNTGLTALGSPGTHPSVLKSESSTEVFPASSPAPEFVEAQTWQKDAQGRIVLVASVTSPPIRTGGACDGGLSRTD